MDTYTREHGDKQMSQMSEIDMIVDEVVEMVEERCMYLSTAMVKAQVKYAMSEAVYDYVYAAANEVVYPATP